ncbi:alpha/beta fold hydrolase [Halobacteriales archaeon Cl-PHB]
MPTAPSLQRHDIAADDGTTLRLYEVAAADADEAVLCLHGGITNARALFAPPVGDDNSHSWLHAIAGHGRSAFALDIRGYGESDPVPEFDDPADANDPPVRAWDAAHDVKAASDAVADRVDTVHLLGVSWGTMTGGSFLEQYDDRPASFVQCAPVYRSPVDFEAAAAALGLDPDLGAYMVEEYDVVRERQGGGAVFEAVWQAMMDSNQGRPGDDAYVAQTGALADTQDCCDDDPPYDAAAIDVPTLVCRGSEDHTSQREDALTLYDEIDVEDDESEYAEVRGGDHFVMHGHRRQALYDLVNDFHDRV